MVLQTTDCMDVSVPPILSKCITCAGDGTDDVCRFTGFRYFMQHIQTRACIGFSYVSSEAQKNRAPPAPPVFSHAWNRHPTEDGIGKIKVQPSLPVTFAFYLFSVHQAAVVRALLPTLEKELAQVKSCRKTLSSRPRESDCRATCGMPFVLVSSLPF